jgi:transposase
MDLDKDLFCTLCNSSYTITFPKKKDELYHTPEYCPFCGESLKELDEDYSDFDDTEDDN